MKKTVVRIPGPSWMLNRWMLKINPRRGPFRDGFCFAPIGCLAFQE